MQCLIQHKQLILGFVVVEAKKPQADVALEDHVPQVVLQLYASAKSLE
jgi:hypothetical protein